VDLGCDEVTLGCSGVWLGCVEGDSEMGLRLSVFSSSNADGFDILVIALYWAH